MADESKDLLFRQREAQIKLTYFILGADLAHARIIHRNEFELISLVPSTKRLQHVDALLQNEGDS